MATTPYESALKMAVLLSYEEQLRLIQELEEHAIGKPSTQSPRSIMDLCGLGKEIWDGIDAQEYVRQERASWNG